MRLTIRNIRAIASAELDIDRLTMVSGPNRAGKSTLALALAAALRREKSPAGYTSTNPDAIIRRGEDGARVVLAEDGGASVALAWQRGAAAPAPRIQGQPPDASEIAVGWGLESLEPFAGREWIDLLHRLAGEPEPTAEDIDAALQDAGIAADAERQAILTRINDQGWDAVAKVFATEAKRHAARWESIAGTRYGAEKAAGWEPEGLLPEVAEARAETLKAAVDQADAALGQAIAAQAAREAQAQAREAAKQASSRLADTSVRLASARQRLSEARSLVADSLACPCCGKPVYIAIIDRKRMIKHGHPDKEEHERRARDAEKIKREIEELEAEMSKQARMDL